MNRVPINLTFVFDHIYALHDNDSHFNKTSRKYNLEEGFHCDTSNWFYNSSLGIDIAVPEWEALASVIILSIIVLATTFGNVLVILGVFTYRPLRIVQNFYIVSLAVADLAVAILVMPLNIAYGTLGKWYWGKHMCKMWLTCDIMSCTSSILNLCAIALDRYNAITDPIKYASKRTMGRVMFQVIVVWILSLVISSPPLLGWNDWPDEFTPDTPCQLTSEPGYVVYSSLGSFFIPLMVMTIVYIKIYSAAKKRLRKRTFTRVSTRQPVVVIEPAQESSERNKESDNESDSGESIKRCQRKAFMDIKKNLFLPLLLLNGPVEASPGQTIETDHNRTSPRSCECIGNKISGSIKKISNRKRRQEPLLANVNNSGDVVREFFEQKQKISLSKERRAARTLGVIMGVFVVCWLPFFLMYITLSFCPTCCPINRLISFITWLGYANSTINPLIYTIFNLDFRKAFKKLLGCTR